MSYDNNNIFAKILRGEIPCDKVYETDHAFAFRDINPQAPVHTLVIPKGAYVSFADFSEKASAEEVVDFVRAVGHVARLEGVSDDGYRLLANIGKNGVQDVPHLHVHVTGGKHLGCAFPPSAKTD
ncbi:histidine triad nucleotide-binding protein [Terasakiella pusilla]|uniref:histidine triad nucleotide-binding protein n=1 Tax=Terasakiella pusilla TaxID=64973 RepID=UPI00048F380C|nr:histidine triad nucleotide-binding protein [Terasakiella pusilla]